MTASIIAQAKSLIRELRDQAKAALTTAAQIEEKAAAPAQRLTEMGERRAALLHQLDTLDAEMVPVRQEYEALRAEHVHYTVVAEQNARAADYYEGTTLPAVQQILAAPPAPSEQPPAGDPPPPRDETEHVPAPDNLPFNVVDSTNADWLKAGSPLVTAHDVPAPDTDGPRHAKPKPKHDLGTGAFKAIVGRLAHPGDDTPQEA